MVLGLDVSVFANALVGNTALTLNLKRMFFPIHFVIVFVELFASFKIPV